MRLFAALLLLAGCASGQAKPDFSGIFLRSGTAVGGSASRLAPPRIIEVRQTAEEVVVTAIQNGETAAARYRFNSKKPEEIQALLKASQLILKGRTEPLASSSSIIADPVITLEEIWTLSPDLQQLTIKTTPSAGKSDTDVYLRQVSLREAEAEARKVKSQCVQATPLSSSMKTKVWKLDGGDLLGSAAFEQITTCVGYQIFLSGDFFKGLERFVDTDGVKFRRAAQHVTSYNGQLLLTVQPTPSGCWLEFANWTRSGPVTEGVQQLRFTARWLGSEPEDLGEVSAEFVNEPMRESSLPAAYYQMQIPAEGVPLSDELEVVVFSRTGEELACLRGHL
jgi:hypothetical protein